MRRPSTTELRRLARAAVGRVTLMTVAPELPGALGAIRWCRARRIGVSLGHSEAGGIEAARAVDAGARAVTHVFNGMRPFHHRHPSLVDAALSDPRLVAMVIADGVHVSGSALRLLLRAKGPAGVALVTDSVRHQQHVWKLIARRGAYVTRRGTLAGSALTMMRAVRNAVELGGVSLAEAVQMASRTPAGLVGRQRLQGSITVGKRADLVSFDRHFRVRLTIVNGTIVYRNERVR